MSDKNTSQPKKPRSEKQRAALQRLAESRRGSTISEAHKQKCSEALQKKYAEDVDFRERQRQAAIKTATDPEVRKKNSAAQQRIQKTPEYRQRQKEAMAQPEVREKIRQTQLGRVHTEEHNRKIGETTSTSQTERWSLVPMEVRREYTLAGRKASQEANTSNLEVQIKGLLDALGVEYIQQYEVSLTHVDFYIPSRHLIIEVYGCYWHQCELCGHPDLGKRTADMQRQYFLRSQGYDLYILWEHDMKNTTSVGMRGLLTRMEGG